MQKNNKNFIFSSFRKRKTGYSKFQKKRIMCFIVQKYCHRNQLFDKTRKNERHCKKLINL